MKKIHFNLWLCIALFLSICACKKENQLDCFKGTGSESSIEILPGKFTQIEVDSKLIVEIKQGATERVTITSGSKLGELVDVEVRDGVLYLKDGNKCNWSRSYKNEIHVLVECIQLTKITQFGGGLIFSNDTIHSDQFTVDVKNSGDVNLILRASTTFVNNHVSAGDIYVSGTTGVSYVFNSGNGFIYAKDLLSDITFLGNHSTAKCYVSASDLLEVTIDGIGDVFYYGNPKVVKTNITDSGKLIKE